MPGAQVGERRRHQVPGAMQRHAGTRATVQVRVLCRGLKTRRDVDGQSLWVPHLRGYYPCALTGFPKEGAAQALEEGSRAVVPTVWHGKLYGFLAADATGRYVF